MSFEHCLNNLRFLHNNVNLSFMNDDEWMNVNLDWLSLTLTEWRDEIDAIALIPVQHLIYKQLNLLN